MDLLSPDRQAHRVAAALPALPDQGIMGILNVTPDSFYAHSRVYANVNQAVDRGLRLYEAGAHIIDIGGESTRPGSHAVDVDTELARVMPVLAGLKQRLPGVSEGGPLLSVDTCKPTVMAAAIRAGAHCINDVNALQSPGALAVLQRNPHVYVCLMHKQGEPATMQHQPTYRGAVCEAVVAFLHQRIQCCISAGISRDRLFIDPGIGFGKKQHHNLQLIRHLGQLRDLKCRVLLGVSRKSVIADVLGEGVAAADRLWGSIGASIVGVCQGAQWIRTHDVRATLHAMHMALAVLNA